MHGHYASARRFGGRSPNAYVMRHSATNLVDDAQAGRRPSRRWDVIAEALTSAAQFRSPNSSCSSSRPGG